MAIAENIERIYKQNCQNLGLLTSTNFSLIDRIRVGEEIPLSEFTAGEDEITRQVIEHGGLFPFNVARMQGKVFLPPIKTEKRPMTLAEKIFARHMVNSDREVGIASVKPGDTGFTRVDLRFSHEYVSRNVVAKFGIIGGTLRVPRQVPACELLLDQLGIFGEEQDAAV